MLHAEHLRLLVLLYTVCNAVTELSADTNGSIEYPATNGVRYVANMNCLWRLHSTAGKVSTAHFNTAYIAASVCLGVYVCLRCKTLTNAINGA